MLFAKILAEYGHSAYSQAGQYAPEGGTILYIGHIMKKTAALTLMSSTTAS